MTRIRAYSAREVHAIKTSGVHWVAPSLYLQVRNDGTRSWLFRYMRHGKAHWHGLGSIRDVNLQEARLRAEELRIDVRRNGAHPIADRKAKVERTKAMESSTAPTFGWCATQYIEAKEIGWKSPVHRRQWEQTLTDYAGPVIGKTPVDQVGVPEVLKVLEPLWRSKPETAGRLRGRISKVLGWAKAKGYRSGDDPAARGGPLDHLLPALGTFQRVRHHKAVPYAEVPDVVKQLRTLESTSSKVLIWTILTAVRTSEALGTLWEEIDEEARLWSLPAERMKAKREHKVPLPSQAMTLLESMPARKGLVFPGAKKGRPLSNMAMVQCLRGFRDDGSTVHGFRSSFSTWARERSGFSEEVIEHALAHGHKSKVIAAYARTTRLDERRELMQAWADYCFSAG
jgi:integrase